MPTPPASFNVLQTVFEKLGTDDVTTLFPSDGSDQLQSCTIAAAAHAITVFSGLAGTLNVMSGQDVAKLYYQRTGGIDSGLAALDVLNFWQSNGINGNQIQAFAKINPSNHDNVMSAISLFGGIYVGFHVQENCVQEFQNHQPWSPGPLTTRGHAVFAVEYGAAGLTVLTWGNTQSATWDWWDECVDEAYALIPANIEIPGVNMQQLQNDLAAVAS